MSMVTDPHRKNNLTSLVRPDLTSIQLHLQFVESTLDKHRHTRPESSVCIKANSPSGKDVHVLVDGKCFSLFTLVNGQHHGIMELLMECVMICWL